MNKGDPKTPRRTILSVSGLVILSLMVLCGVDQVKAQSQWTTNGNNINNTNSGNVGVGTTTPSFKFDVVGSINTSGSFCLQGDCRSSWAQVANQWSTGIGGTNLYYLGGNVGIGANPLIHSPLTVLFPDSSTRPRVFIGAKPPLMTISGPNGFVSPMEVV